jgi:succinate dehydrogenase hydrophobic anchor subunit
MCVDTAANATRKAKSRLTRFGRDEDGALIVFALFLFLLMATMGGVAIDVMRYEATRTNLANTLDRCTLMAASMHQRLDPKSVVEDCVAKAGLSDQLESVVVIDSVNSRDVRAKAVADTEPMFLHLIGIDEFDAKAGSRAIHQITNIELSLVLDVSGSMQGAKIANLKTAASEFVETVLENDTDDRTSIALVPYNGQVNLGATLRQQYNTTDQHGAQDVNCIDLPTVVYGTTTLNTATPMPMTAHADTFSTTNAFNGYLAPTDGWAVPHPLNRWCPPMPGNIVRLPNNDVDLLQAQINGLTAIGATSINAGLKWGLTLLDPASQPMLATLAGAGQMPAAFADRPVQYDDVDTMKVIVLMTDGSHFAEERVNDGYRTGISPIYRANGGGQYSIFHASHPGAAKFYVPHMNAWQPAAFDAGTGTAQQTWEQVWTNQRMSWVAWQLYARPLGSSAASQNAQYTLAMDAFRSRTATGNMDAQLQQICGLAKDQDVIIYGIAFEAPAAGAAQIAQCSSSPQHYFPTTGPALSATFNSIANNLSMLKLTQ